MQHGRFNSQSSVRARSVNRANPSAYLVVWCLLGALAVSYLSFVTTRGDLLGTAWFGERTSVEASAPANAAIGKELQVLRRDVGALQRDLAETRSGVTGQQNDTQTLGQRVAALESRFAAPDLKPRAASEDVPFARLPDPAPAPTLAKAAPDAAQRMAEALQSAPDQAAPGVAGDAEDPQCAQDFPVDDRQHRAAAAGAVGGTGHVRAGHRHAAAECRFRHRACGWRFTRLVAPELG